MFLRDDMDKDPNAYPVVGGMRRPAGTQPRGAFYNNRVRCENCLCSDEGDMYPNPVPPGKWDYTWCKVQDTPLRCQLWFKCFCQATMHQPEIERGNSITSYQNALNDIPFRAKAQHPGFHWNPADRFSMTWLSMAKRPAGSEGEAPSQRELVPGTKEPYYLEGPSGERDREWLESKLTGLGTRLGGLGSGSGSVAHWKRSELEEEGPEESFEKGKPEKEE
ncbi:hypothetical protein TWF281_002331 [Arthrobotrys megalospora]